ncbi:unnamed protein product [Angiostrongylus costaricensis]|uniref:Transposase n=1 Tax=Angiostrongylus costaricensis TaxID=334426 RepID=A0A0R3PUB0_ANGCS|nr:unnamed protein product [Angiostrongylus costaricensis]
MDIEYDWLTHHLHACAIKGGCSKLTKKRLTPETLELKGQHGFARSAGNRQLSFSSELAKQCRQMIKEGLIKIIAAVVVEAAEPGKSTHKLTE